MNIKNKKILSAVIGATALCTGLALHEVSPEKNSLAVNNTEINQNLEVNKKTNQGNTAKNEEIKNTPENNKASGLKEELKDISSDKKTNALNEKIKNTINNTETNALKEEAKNIDYRNYIQVDGSVSDNLISLLNDELNKVPNSVIEEFLSIGGKIILTSHDIATTYYNDYSIGSLMELHDGRQQILYISAREKAIKEGATHGMGHVLDSITGWNSFKNRNFLDIYHKEQHTLQTEDGSTYHKGNEREFFAEVFYQYLINPDRTANSAPQAVKFINNLVHSI